LNCVTNRRPREYWLKKRLMSNDTKLSRPLRVGFITTGLYFDPAAAQNRARFEALSRGSTGEIFGVVYDGSRTHEFAAYRARLLSLPRWLGGYGFLRSSGRAVAYVCFVIGSAIHMRLTGQRRFDLLVASDPFKSGELARLASRILGIPYAVELNGNYDAAMALQDGATQAWYMRVKAKLAKALMPRVLRRAAAIKLLYEAQLGQFESPDLLRKTHVFHNLVPLDPFRPEPCEQPYLLLLGHPWLLKGADLAIRAFLQESEKFPEFHLHIVGYCPNPAQFEKLAGGHPRIHLHPAGVVHREAVGLINRCFALLLPSRTEGMGRVLLEAMAAAKPIVGAHVDGIPRVIRHEQNGLLFESGNAQDLAVQLRRLMADTAFARSLGENGWADVHQRLSPAAYEAAYLQFLAAAAGPLATG
jgi:glycosyltransferase involved in cell wall biosynthesis